MAGKRRRARRHSELTWEQQLELIFGPHGRRPGMGPSAFATAAERRAAWFACDPREFFGGDTPGRRSWAWWHYESPEPRDRDIPETEQLRRMGVLTDAEERQLRAEELYRLRILGQTGDEDESLLEAAAAEEAAWAAEFDDGLW